MSTACRRNTTTSSVCTPTTFFVSGCTPLLLVGRGGVSSPAHARHEGRVVEDAFRIEVRSTNRGYRRLMPGVVSALGQRVLPACAILFRVRSSHAVVWPGHKSYPLGVLDGTDGFRVTAEGSTGRLGYSVAGAGDVNNDGFTDIIIGESPEFSTTAGAAYVIFGSGTFSAVELDVSTLDGTNGFKVEGADLGDFTGTSVAGAGDVNGDGFDDIAIGAWGASSAAGQVLVIFGAPTLPAVVTTSYLDGAGGFLVRGATTSDAAGFAVAAAGDVNNDGAADIIIGAFRADPSGSMSGEAYVVLGSLSWILDIIDLADLGSGGLTFHGGERREYAGYSVAGAGDVNDDGYSDIVIAAYGISEAYVFYGAATFSSATYALDTLSGVDGFIVSAGNDGDALVVARAGDINGDGYGDIAIGRPLADPATGNSAGVTHVILGGGDIQSPINALIDLDGSNGFTLVGAGMEDRSGTSVSAAGDVNQDGLGDIIVGAPGVGDNTGSAYIVFGSELFSEASYTLGSIGAAGSFVLSAPIEGGYGGFSVAGAGDMNQDGFPDVVVGAYDSGMAGEVFVVFPHLTGTPPPTPSPTPAPTGPTPAPVVPIEGSTPSPTVNFLTQGVVGGGTIYEGPGVFVRAQELGGQVLLGVDRWFDESTRVSINLEGLQEKDSAGGLVGLAAPIPHVVEGGGLVYEAMATSNVTVGGVAAQRGIMTTTVLGGDVTIAIMMYIIEEDGAITNGDEQIEVFAGHLKVSISVTGWPFCDPTTAPTADDDNDDSVSLSTVCTTGASSSLETGAYLDMSLAVRGPSSSIPAPQSNGDVDSGEGGDWSEDSFEVGGGLKYLLSGGSADATLVMSEWVQTDDLGWTKSEAVSRSSSTFSVRFPASAGTLYYDPTFEIVRTSDDAVDGFWETTWFIVAAAALGVLLMLCFFGLSAWRRRRATKDKVTPSFEGVVAPAVEIGGGDGNAERGKRRGVIAGLKMVACFCRKRRRKPKTTTSGQNTGSSKTVDDGAKRSARLPSLFRRSTFRNSSTTRSRPRWRGKGNAVTNQKVAGTAPLAEGGRGGSSAAGGGDGALATEEATPDWIKNLGGAPAPDANTVAAENDAAAATDAVIPDWLAEVAGPSVNAVATANAKGNSGNEQVYDENYYGQGYEGYEGYEEYAGYGGYGYDGYGYDGYHDAGYYEENVGVTSNTTNIAGTPVVTPPPNSGVTGGGGGGGGGGGAGGGGGLSWLTNAASTVNALNEDADGGATA